MQTYMTVNSIKTEMEALYRNLSGKAAFTAVECDIVYSAIIDAYQMAMLEYGVDTFTFIETDQTVTTTADQNYVNLDEYVFKVVNGSARIPAKSQLLGLIDEVSIFQADPNAESTGVPSQYAYMASGDPNIIRLRLYPTPNAEYTLNMKVLKYPPDVITNFPTWLQSAIKNKAKALSALGLGVAQLAPGFNEAYEEAIRKVKDGYRYDGPRHIGRSVRVSRPVSTESRISE